MDTNEQKEQKKDVKGKTVLGMKLWLFILLLIGVVTLIGGIGYAIVNRRKKQSSGDLNQSIVNRNAIDAINRYDSNRERFNLSEE